MDQKNLLPEGTIIITGLASGLLGKICGVFNTGFTNENINVAYAVKIIYTRAPLIDYPYSCVILTKNLFDVIEIWKDDMGLFNVIRMEAKCPVCHTNSVFDFKAPALGDKMQLYIPGDRISDYDDDYDFIEVTGVCKNSSCIKDGQGSPFKANIRIHDGILTNSISDITPIQ